MKYPVDDDFVVDPVEVVIDLTIEPEELNARINKAYEQIVLNTMLFGSAPYIITVKTV